MITIAYAPSTGSGMMRSSCVTFGRKESTQKITPMQTPTRRAAIPVISTTETLLE